MTDMGLAGRDQGKGGKYLILPPGYDGEVPDGYFVAQSQTYSNWLVIRALDGVDSCSRRASIRCPRRQRRPRWSS